MKLEIGPSPEELPAAYDVALEVCIFLSGELPSCPFNGTEIPSLALRFGVGALLALRALVIRWDWQRYNGWEILRPGVIDL